ncbi:DUF2891 family protein [Streptomyces puniciscabiei]|uniref:DUF2891 family protein n=1 Tax=Streptomyces puniciscabiei TaxID=164348 RepID=A0A542TI76_9ACTN|nr:DUF2891 family protein [Streptomyces puniciscabiei]TQK86541.1 DUF2891 family protein [Streptomyces puniciscabiei]
MPRSAHASGFARPALADITREYPDFPAHPVTSPDEEVRPSTLHPAFQGADDWHSSVHMHWLLVHLLRRHGDTPAFPAHGAGFLPAPRSGAPCPLLEVPVVSDHADRTSAICWVSPSAGPPRCRTGRSARLAEAAEAHLAASLPAVERTDFTTGHWPATFAALALGAGSDSPAADVA